MDAALNDPDRAEFLAERDPTCKKSSKELIEEILMMLKLPVNSLQSGAVSKRITYAESKSAIKADDEDEDSGAIVGIPLWLELHFRNDFRKSQIKGSQKTHFNELFRFFVKDDLGDSYIKIEVYTSTLFGKRLLGTTHLSLSNVPPHQIIPLTLSIDENEHGLIVAQVKLTPKTFTMPLDELKRKNNVRAKLKSSFPFLTLRDRHQTESAVDEQKLKELKQVLRVEANVYLDYPCCYDGLDHLGRVILRNLNQLGEQIAEDIFSCIRAHGNLQLSLKRPMDLLTLERENTGMLRSIEAVLCVGRNELLKSVQEYVHSIQSAPNRILLVCGSEGTGKTNLMAFVYNMYVKGIRIARNAHTGMLETISLASHNPSRRGHSWNEPEVIYLPLRLSLGGTDMRWFLFSLMTMLSEIYHGSVYPTFDSTNLPKNNALKLFPVPGEYNNLKLDFFNLCSVMDRLSPMRFVLIVIDDIEKMDPLKFDWLPMSIPSSMRLILACKSDTVVQSISSENPALDVVTCKVPPMSVYARKELLRHSLVPYKKSLSMEQVSVLIQKQDASSPDYLFLSSTSIGNFDRIGFHITKMIAEFEPTLTGLSHQILENMEVVCGRELLKHTLCLIATSKYGLTESELLVLLADVGMFDALKYRLTDEYSSQDKSALLNPQTPLEKRLERQKEPNARLPYGLWAPVRHLLKPHVYTSESSIEQLFAFRLQRFVRTLELRYNLDNPETVQGRVFFHGRLASYFRARADPELQFSWRGDDFRPVQCLVHHLVRANDWITTSKILTDLGFLELSVSLGNCYGLCSDLSHALLESEKNDEIFSRHRISELTDVNTFLNANADLLHTHPKLLLQMMANESNTSAVSRMALNRALNGWEGRNWLRWINRPTLASNNIRTLHGHKGWIRSLALTKDRKYIVSAADDRTAKFWIGESGAFAHELRGHRASITSVDISSSSRFIITASMDSSVKLWDIELQVELANLYVGSAAMSCAFSSDGKYILAGTQNSTLHLFTTSSYEEIHVLHGHRLGVRSCVFTNDSAKILSGGLDTVVMLWEIGKFVGKGKHVHAASSVLKGHTQGVRAVACNPRNPDQFVSGGDDCSILVWSLSKKDILRQFSGHTGSVYALAYTPSGQYIISGSYDSTVQVWSQNVQMSLHTFSGHSGPVFTILASADEYTCISAGADSTIRTWDLRGLLRVDVHEKQSTILVATDRTASAQSNLKSQYGCLNAISFSSDGVWLLSGSSDNTFAIRKTESGKLKCEPIRGHVAAVNCCQFHPEGQLVLTGSEDTFLKLWDASTNILISTFQGHTKSVTGTSFFNTGLKFASCSLDSSIRVWDVAYGRELFTVDSNLGHKNAMGQSECVRCCAVSPNDHTFVTGGDDNVIRIWDDRIRSSVRKFIGHRLPITACSFSSDGGTLISASLDNTAILWDLRASVVYTCKDHSAAVSSVAFSSSGRHFVTASWDKFVIAYSSSTFKEVARWPCRSACHSVAATSQYSGVVGCGDSTGSTYVLRTVLAPCAQWRFF
uniref:C2 domain-containing protein n=1 Tax=Cryptomonas curvata TaxID=233186 RepID=A0A7S0MQX2_9CRYP